MQKLRSRLRTILVMLTVPMVATCGSDPTTVSDIIASIIVTPGNPSLAAIGLTQQFVATARDASGNSLTGKTFTWTSSAAGVATIDGTTGMAMAVGNGTATITAMSEGISGSAVLEISQAVSSVTVTAPANTLASFGETTQLTAAAVDANANAVNNATATWASSDPAIATVSTSGVVTAVSNGVVTITATMGGVGGTIDITVAQQASQLSMSQQPSPSAGSGAVFAQQPAVQLLDANGNAVAQSGVSITASIATGGGTLSGTTVATTAANGIATFTDLAITGTSGSRTLSFSSGSLVGTTSTAIAVGAGSVDPGQSNVTAPTSVTTGTPVNVVVQTADAAGTPISVGGATVAVTVTGANPNTPTVVDNNDGTYTATYTPTASGTDNVAVTINGGTAANSPLAITVTVGAADPTTTTATITGGPANTATTITVQANDAFGNALTTGGATVVVAVSGTNSASPSVTDNSDGTYSASYTPTAAGTDNINISLNGTAINGSPFTNVVGVGSADAAQTTATVPAGTSGALTSITIQTRDAAGTALTVGGENITANVTGANSIAAAVTDNGDGTYTATYTPLIAGTDNIAIALNGTAIGGSPYTSQVAPGPLSPTQSTAVVPTTGTSGVVTTMTITARDANSNALTVGGATLVISITGANTTSPTFTDNGDGTYTSSYTPTAVGIDNITINMNGASVSGSPFLSTVSAGAVNPAASTATVPTTTVAAATAAIVVTARDVNGNAIGVGGHTVVVSVAGANTATPTVTDNSDGTYSASYTPLVAGTDNITITLNGTAITGSPFANTITVGAADPAQSTAVIPSGAAGTASVITVTARDAGGNAVAAGGATIVVDVTGANTATPAVTDNGDGTYTATYTPTAPGTDNIAITMNGTALTGSPFASVVGVGAADPVQTTATVPAGTAGAVTTISIQSRDAAGNNLTVGGEAVAVAVTGANTATATITDNADGTYTATYTPTVVGTDNLAITLNATAIGGGPYTSAVAPGAVDPAQSTAVVPATATAGAVTNITVTANDANGNQQAAGGATVVVAITGANTATPAITDNGDGTYATSYTPTAAGSDAVAITINGTAIGGSPFASVVGAGAADPAQTLATVPANGAAGTATAITVTTQDANGNPLTTGGATVVVTITGANAATPVVTDNADGTYTTSYTPTLAGTDNVAITLNGAAIASSPFTSTVAAGAADPATSTAVVPPTVVSGAASAITVTARDANNNQLAVGGATVVINVTGANTATPVVTDNADGTYTASYTPTLVGTDNVAITLNGTAIASSPFTSTVAPGAADPATTTVVVPANGTVGVASAITVTARDANGNQLVVGGATVVVSVTGANAVSPVVTDNANGTYSASYTPTVSGTDNIAITLNGAAINGSPFASTISTGVLDPAQSTAVVPATGTAGALSAITITARDAGGNALTVGGATAVVNVTGANTVSPAVIDNTDGTYSTSYTPTVAGTDNIAITLNGTAINLSPFTSTIAAGALDPAQTTAVVPGIGTQGAPTNMTVTARDANGNQVAAGGATVVVSVTGANTASPTPTDNGNGTYSASYTPANNGTDNIAITLNGTAVIGSPFTSVTGGNVSPAQTTATIPAGTAGVAVNITVTARDGTGTPVGVGGNTVAITITGPNANVPAVTDVGDGTYTASYTPTVAGTAVDTIAITIEATTIGGSPFTNTVAPAALAIAASTITKPDTVPAGTDTTVTVVTRDSFGNQLTSGGATVVVFISGDNPVNLPATDVGDGTYTVTYSPLVVGSDDHSATINGTTIGGGPYTSIVVPGTSSAPQSTAVVPTSGAVGVATNITVQAKDSNGNNRTIGGDTVVVTITGANTINPVVTDAGNGTYTASYTPTASGVDNIAITLNSGGAINGSPFTSTVGAGAANPALSTATVPATGTVGVVTAITVQAKDGTGTNLTTGGEIVAINVTGANTTTPIVTDVGDGTYTASYTPTLAGTDNIAITMNSSPIGGSPYSSVVAAAGPSAPNSIAIVPNGTTGTPTDIFIQARDIGNNDITVGGAVVVVTVSGANSASPAVTDNADGTYTASYTPGSNGTDNVAITLGGVAIDNSPYTSQVSAVTAMSGQIVFESDRDTGNGNTDVFVMDAVVGGGTVINITNNPYFSDERPSVSPDGTKIVFNSNRDGDHDIYVMNSNGSGVTQLTNSAGPDRIPEWSPDGSQIVFLSERDGDSEIFVMNADGSNQTNITNNGFDDFQATWSPDGLQIAFYRAGDVYVINANGSGETNLTNSPLENDYESSWGAGGIVFASDRDGVGLNTTEVYKIQSDGTGLTRLTNNTTFDLIPEWSNDGSQVIWINAGDIYRMNADGTSQELLFSDSGLKWAPKYTP